MNIYIYMYVCMYTYVNIYYIYIYIYIYRYTFILSVTVVISLNLPVEWSFENTKPSAKLFSFDIKPDTASDLYVTSADKSDSVNSDNPPDLLLVYLILGLTFLNAETNDESKAKTAKWLIIINVMEQVSVFKIIL
jgi:hypothetical protein